MFNIATTCITWCWWHLPLSRERKELVKTIVFRSFPFIFRNSKVYQNWNEARVWTMTADSRHPGKNNDPVQEVRQKNVADERFLHEPIKNEPIAALAIVIHAFHLEIFKEIMEYLKNEQEIKVVLYVTCPESILEKIDELLSNSTFEYKSMPVENRGRDILPFLEILPQVFMDGYEVILKIHTKKSDYRMTGALWRNDLFKKLLKKSAIKQALKIFNSDCMVGMVGAPGHMVPMNLYYGANAKKTEMLAIAMGVVASRLHDLIFPAGSMFYARKQALLPLLNLGLESKDFEEELGQKDGTLAHAVERAFAVSAAAANLTSVDMSYDPQKQSLTITKNHPFTH